MTAAIFYKYANPGHLHISGPDRIDFLQRQSTNDLALLADGKVLSTVVTNPAARIIDVLQLYPDEEETLSVLTLPGRGTATSFFLKKRIFFMDKVAVTDLSSQVFLIDMDGKDVLEVLKSLGLEPPEPGTVRTGTMDGVRLHLIGQTGREGDAIRITGPEDYAAILVGEISKVGAAEVTQQVHETRRIEAGLPGPQGELVEEYTPLETGLEALISNSKGCYTGQEVIARQITYDKVTRRLAGISLTSPAEAGSRVLVDGSPAGVLTSYAYSSIFGPIGLSVLKRPFFEPGTAVEVTAGSGLVTGQVSVLPFRS